MPLMPDSKVAKDRYHVCLKTLRRWDDKRELQFPAAKIINNRKYRDTDELDAWDAVRANVGSLKAFPRGAAARFSKDATPIPSGASAVSDDSSQTRANASALNSISEEA